MGFFSDLLKCQAKKAIKNIIDDAISKVTDNNNNPAPAPNAVSKTPTELLRERLKAAFASQFPAYEVKENISSLAPAGRAYTYGLYSDGQPKAFFMIMLDKNDYRKKEVVLSKNAALEAGIPYMNFMPYLPNTPEYIAKKENWIIFLNYKLENGHFGQAEEEQVREFLCQYKHLF